MVVTEPTRALHLLETVDLLYDAFGRHRTGAAWSKAINASPGFTASGTWPE